MSLLRIEKVPNGDIWTKVYFYSCDRCGSEIFEAHPHVEMKEKHYCLDCSFINKLITEKKYLNHIGISLDNAHASMRDGKVVVWIGNRPPWERTSQDIRNSLEYSNWRKAVYERDKYTCQHCGQVGGKLNAHHIKPFAKYKSLRFDVDNGLTLCVSCHRKAHKKKG